MLRVLFDHLITSSLFRASPHLSQHIIMTYWLTEKSFFWSFIKLSRINEFHSHLLPVKFFSHVEVPNWVEHDQKFWMCMSIHRNCASVIWLTFPSILLLTLHMCVVVKNCESDQKTGSKCFNIAVLIIITPQVEKHFQVIWVKKYFRVFLLSYRITLWEMLKSRWKNRCNCKLIH